jgi:fructose-1,6-bisphosphatase
MLELREIMNVKDVVTSSYVEYRLVWYVGSLVGDFHQTMLYGGICGYPANLKE